MSLVDYISLTLYLNFVIPIVGYCENIKYDIITAFVQSKLNSFEKNPTGVLTSLNTIFQIVLKNDIKNYSA